MSRRNKLETIRKTGLQCWRKSNVTEVIVFDAWCRVKRAENGFKNSESN